MPARVIPRAFAPPVPRRRQPTVRNAPRNLMVLQTPAFCNPFFGKGAATAAARVGFSRQDGKKKEKRVHQGSLWDRNGPDVFCGVRPPTVGGGVPTPRMASPHRKNVPLAPERTFDGGQPLKSCLPPNAGRRPDAPYGMVCRRTAHQNLTALSHKNP